MQGKLTLAQLEELILDPSTTEESLAPYFEAKVNPDAPFSVDLQISTDTVDTTTEPADTLARRSAGILSIANTLSRSSRKNKFNRKRSDPNYKGPIIVSEGDSWFQYPIKLEDTIDHLQKEYAVRSLGAAGDTMRAMVQKGEYLKAVQRVNADILLFSAGGNDLLASSGLSNHLNPWEEGVKIEDLLRPSFDALVAKVLKGYDQIFRTMESRAPKVHIFVHGYDLPIPDGGPWLGKPMSKAGVKDPTIQKALAGEMMNRFNQRLLSLTQSFDQVRYLDMRGIVLDNRWYDELHPTNPGYADVATRFQEEIQEVFKQSSRRTKPSTSSTAANHIEANQETGQSTSLKSRSARSPVIGRQGLSLHIGLDEVDPEHYSGWRGKLNACEFDAEDMEAVAENVGYETSSLIRENATRENVIEAIATAASQLDRGDIFLLTYSGHGGQLPDYSGDEEDRIDETWCLYDGQLIDDEIYESWRAFKAGVRVFMISDSCHSGSVFRSVDGRMVTVEASINGAEQFVADLPRAMPAGVGGRTYRSNRNFYDGLQNNLYERGWKGVKRETDLPISASIRLFSGCMDHQFSYDGVANGHFTERLLRVWNNGRFDGDYASFHADILKQMRSDQTSQHRTLGAVDHVYDQQLPFSI